MNRKPNTTVSGGPFSLYAKEQVWQKGQVVAGYNPKMYRKDQCGAWMKWSAYGTTGDYGWEIDHKFPVSRGGADELRNVQPLHWRNNRGKGDDYPNWYCTIPSKV